MRGTQPLVPAGLTSPPSTWRTTTKLGTTGLPLGLTSADRCATGPPCRRLTSAIYLRNRSPLSGRDKTPFELFYGTKPDVSHLRIFGATVFAHTPSALRTKLDPVSQPGRLIGYAANRKGYKILLNSGAIITSRDVTFDESKPPKPTSPTSHKPPSQPETSQPEPVPFAFDSDTEDVGAAADAQPPPEDAPPPSPPLAQRRQVRVVGMHPTSHHKPRKMHPCN